MYMLQNEESVIIDPLRLRTVYELRYKNVEIFF